MRLRSVRFLVCVLLAFAATACGGDDSNKSTGPGVSNGGDDDGGSEVVCIDKDHDGFGTGCQHTPDCNDKDPDITDECEVCEDHAESTGCPCDKGTPPTSCLPPKIVVDGGVYECPEGTRYCRLGRWSRCEEAGNYVFVPNG